PEPEPVEEETEPAGYTLADVQQNDSPSSCWSVINGNVYDLTAWIDNHPGGASRIESLCGGDGSSAFNSRHGGQSNAESTLQGYLLGPLS
ncbi:MAG: cytochrome b5-like heme/steroid binding domain-containing protein, partial [Microbacteriaceae bacterium]|nr:cytochrome b5-like heme/steroid binding domain-containing protein [Microbacteriaceae bacterium]